MVYDLLYVDPPWKQSKGGLRKARPKQGRALDYPVISLIQIEQHIHQFVSEDKPQVMFLWTIDKFLHESEKLGERLGFRLHARLIWNKGNGVAPAFTVRFGHEYLLWMWRGKFPPIDLKSRGRFLSVFSEPATKHSKKPVAAYEMLEALYPFATRIELYARNRRVGWDAWGNEV